MKFKKNLKRFWTLSRQQDGFTLVELIVVIAILAILAGVAVPAYSGYIEKANYAADEQLLANVNTAFAAACAINGEDHYNVKTIPTFDVDTMQLTHDYKDDFDKFFEGGEFKVIEALRFENGVFVDAAMTAENNLFNQIFNSISDKISGSVSSLNNSTFGTIGAAGLMEKVDVVTNLAAELADINSDFKNVLAGNSASMAAALGYDLSDPTEAQEYSAKLMEMVNQIAPGTVVNGEVVNSDAFNKATNQLLANYAVLQAAQSTNKTSDVLLGELQAGIDTEDIKNLMTSQNTANTQEGLSKAAMMYAMYTAYANQMPEGTEEEKAAKNEALESAKSVEGFLANMESDGFQAYLNDAEGSAKTDLEGYLGALDIINKSAQDNPDAVSDLLVNGYTDPELVSALQGLLGK